MLRPLDHAPHGRSSRPASRSGIMCRPLSVYVLAGRLGRSAVALRGNFLLGRRLRTTAYVLVAAAWLTPAARGQTPAPTPEPAPAVSAPLVASSPAAVGRMDCVQSCGTAGVSRTGSLVRVRGKALTQADEVVFMGAPGDAD